MHFGRGCFAAPLVILLSALPVQSQTPAGSNNNLPTFQSKVRVVLVDVVVTSKDKPVSGLQKTDFEILEDNRHQTLLSFEEHSGAPSTPIKLPQMPPNVFTNYPTAPSDSVNVLLLDALNTQAYDQVFVHSQLVKYIKEKPPGTGLGIFVLDSRLRMIQGVTTDSAALLAAIDDKKNSARFSQFLLTGQQSDTDELLLGGIISPAGQDMARRGLEQSHAFAVNTRITRTLAALQQLARYLAAIPGRKNLIWVSDSFPITIFPNTEISNPAHTMPQYFGQLQQTVDLLTPGQVAIYPISAEGLSAPAEFDASRTAPPSLRNENFLRTASQEAMEELAKDTGGRAYYNTNGLNEAMANAVGNGARYYTLTYSPTNRKMDGKFRHIKLRLINADYKVAYRRGYYADEVAKNHQANPDSDPLMPMMVRGLPDFTQVLYKIQVKPVNPQPSADAAIAGGNTEIKRPTTRYAVDFAIATQDVKLEATADGTHQGSVELVLVAYDRDGSPQNWVIRKPAFTLDPKLFAALQKLGLQFHLEIDAPSGDTYLRTGVYDLESSKVGTLGISLNRIGTDTPVK